LNDVDNDGNDDPYDADSGPGVTINSNTTLSADLDVRGDLLIAAGADLNLNGFTLSLGGNFTVDGTLTSDDGTVILNSERCLQSICLDGTVLFDNLTIDNENGVSHDCGCIEIEEVLDLEEGVFDVCTANCFSMLSDSALQASVDPTGSGTIPCEITLHRNKSGCGIDGFISLATPFTTTNFTEWGDDVLLTGYAGTPFPNFWNNTYFYAEPDAGDVNIGWDEPANITESVVRGRGYNVFVGAYQMPADIDMVGVPDFDPFNFDLFYTPSGFATTADGFNFLGNPYPSAIDWDQNSGWDKIGCCDAVLVWDECTQQYMSYAQGVGTNGGSPIVGSAQGFWVKAHSPGASLTVTRGAMTSTPDNFRSPTTGGHSVLRLSLDGYGESDDCVMRLKSDADYGIGDIGDAPDLESGNVMMGLYTLDSLGAKLGINSIGYDYVNRTIPVMVRVPQTGAYSLALSIEEDFPTDLCMLVKDNLTDQVISVDSLVYHSFVMIATPNFSNRFDIIFTYPLQTAITDVSCFGGNDGSAVFKAQGNGLYDLTWKDISGNILRSVSGITGNDTLTGLAAGSYLIEMFDQNASACQSAHQIFTVEQPQELVLSISGDDQICTNLSASAEVLATGGVAPYTYLWSNGDTTAVATGLADGLHDVIVTDQHGCVNDVIWTVEAWPEISAEFNLPDTVDLAAGPQWFDNVSSGPIDRYQWHFGDGDSSTTASPLHAYLGAGTYQVTLVVWNDHCIDSTTQIIVVVNTTGIETSAPVSAEGIQVFASSGQLHIQLDLPADRDLNLSVLDASGREVLQSDWNAAKHENRTWPVSNLATGSYLVRLSWEDGQHLQKILIR